MNKLSKAECIFYKAPKQQIDRNAKTNINSFPWDKSNPIFIPKRKKKK